MAFGLTDDEFLFLELLLSSFYFSKLVVGIVAPLSMKECTSIFRCSTLMLTSSFSYFVAVVVVNVQ